MGGATLYIVVCSARNRMARRLRRLLEPRYLVGAIAGIGYLVFTLFIRQRAYGVRSDAVRGAGAAAASAGAFGLVGLVGGGVLLAFAAFASWVLPFGSGLLEFSRAEAAFLFPSPLTRRQLVIYRLMRSQFAVFTGALIMALAYPTGSSFARLRSLLAIWVVLMTSHVFFTGVTLARDRLRRGGGAPAFMWPALALPGATVVALLGSIFSRSAGVPIETVSEAVDAVMASAQHGVTSVLLLPFALLVRPLFASTAPEFISALAGALAVYGVALAWLLWADSESTASADASAERQVNQPVRKSRAYVVRPLSWTPAAGAAPEMFFVWKGVLQTFRTVDRRVFLRAFLIVGWMLAASFFVTRARGLVALVGVFSTYGALFTIFMAPQIIRMDMRQDLAHLELLKTWPVRGASVIRGEIAWSAIVVTVIAWTLGLIAMVLSMVSSSRIPTANRFAVWTTFLVVIPALVLAQYTMHNAVAVLFPGWVPLGASRPRGVDAVGQRLILLIANWLGLVIALLPGIALTAVLSLLFRPLVGPWILPLGALLTTAIVVAETMVVTEALGPVFERLDVTSVEPAE
jgi:hypothetical protein